VLTRFRRDPLIGNVLALVALFIALGGVAWAAAKIDSGDVKDNSLKSEDLKDGKGVEGADVAPDSLSGAGIDESSLGQVPSAASADSATDADTLDGKDSGDFASSGSEGWHAANLLSSTACAWHNYGNGQNDAGYFRDPAGVVHLRGLVYVTDEVFGPCSLSSASQREFLTLPLGYRPEHNEALATISNNAPARINVLRQATLNPNEGAVAVEPGFPTTVNAHVWVSIDGLSFRCGPSGQDGCP
jgi:hypothetical protein